MNYRTWSERKFWIVAASLAFTSWFTGVGMGASGEAVTVTETKEVEVIKEVVTEDTKRFDELKAVDEEIFATSNKVIRASQTSLQSTADLLSLYPYMTIIDIEATTEVVGSQTAIIRQATDELDALKAKRDEIINR